MSIGQNSIETSRNCLVRKNACICGQNEPNLTQNGEFSSIFLPIDRILKL